jgi:hypothetical protein
VLCCFQWACHFFSISSGRYAGILRGVYSRQR